MEKLTKKERKELRKIEKQEELEALNKKRNYQKITYFLIGIVGLALIIWGMVVALSPKEPSTALSITSSDITTGSASAKVGLIEYANYECPACAQKSEWVEQLKKDFPEDLRVAFRFMQSPSDNIGMLSSQTAYAAHKQGKFWEMSKVLFENQSVWTTSDNPQALFEQYATDLGLDLEKFKIDQNAQETKEFIVNQYTEGINNGVTYTPSFFLNGQLIEPTTYEEFKLEVENKIGN
jgi:protein-disulfide isomerase